MPHFDIVKKNDPDVTFRVSKIQADFDVKLEHSNERFVGDIEMPNDWLLQRYSVNNCSSKKSAIDYKRNSMRNQCKTASFFYKKAK